MTRHIIPAIEANLPALQEIAEVAYAPYVARIGKRPAPMDADFSNHLARLEVVVSIEEGCVGGFIVSYPREDDQFIENIAVDPALQGKGIGQSLMVFACAQACQNKKQFVRLYTNEKMTESIRTYLKFGFVETGRKAEDGFNRVYMEKRIAQ